MKKNTKKRIVSTLLIIIAIVVAIIGYKVIILEENTNFEKAKTIQKISLEEEKKIFGLEEKDEKVGEVEEQEKITVTKTIDRGNNSDIYEGQVQTYTITIKNNTEQEIKNIDVTDKIPEQLTYVTYPYDQSYQNEYVENKEIKEFTSKIEKIDAKSQAELKYMVRVNKQAEDVENPIGTKATVKIQNDSNVYESNLVQNTIKQSEVQIDFVASTNTKLPIMVEDEISFIIKLQNISEETLNNFEISYKIPEQLNYVRSSYMTYENDIYCEDIFSPIENNNYNEETKTVTWNIEKLDSEEKAGLRVILKLSEIGEGKNKIEIANEAQVKVNEKTYKSNIFEFDAINKLKANIQMKIEPEKTEFYEDEEFEYIVTITPENNANLGTIQLSDEIPEELIGKEIIINDDTSNKMTFGKNANIYLRSNNGEAMTIRILVKVGKLKDGIDKLEIKNKAILSGRDIVTEVSNEVLTVIKKKENADNPEVPGDDDNNDNNNNDNDNNNNNGDNNNNNNDNNNDNNNNNNNNSDDNNNDESNKVAENGKFDVKIDKYVNKVTVKNSQGTYQYNFGDSQLAKLEIDKKEIGNISIVIEYKILLTNVGNIPGYVKKITDNKPEELQFNSELNKNWYELNGKLENTSMKDNVLRAGEKRELTLVLTKQINQNDIKTLTNGVEIAESVNDNRYDDNDTSNDVSNASLIISIKTGKEIQYIIFITILTIITATVIYWINKKVL